MQLDQTSSEWFSGSLLPSSVKGSAWLRLFSDGFYMFEGHVHENGPVSHSWSMAATRASWTPTATPSSSPPRARCRTTTAVTTSPSTAMTRGSRSTGISSTTPA
ncbi:hypothetical protein NKG94_21255 [Micromonospora sp. M12]